MDTGPSVELVLLVFWVGGVVGLVRVEAGMGFARGSGGAVEVLVHGCDDGAVGGEIGAGGGDAGFDS